MQRTHKVIVFKVSLQLDLGVGVNTLSVHFVRDPFASIVALVSPCISPLTMPIAVLEFALINIPICEHIQT
jgi:hypothetical protein